MIRILALIGGMAGSLCLSQFPEFAQQYLQRLAGQADALSAVVKDFDNSASEAGYSREAALADLSGTSFREAHQADLRATFARFERVEADLAMLRAASPLERILLPHRFRDLETLGATWEDFQPAVPVTFPGLVAAGIGFVVGWALIALVVSLLATMFGRQQITRV